MKKKKRFVLKLLGVFVLAAVGLAFFGFLAVARIISDLPYPDQFLDHQITQSTKIYDNTGEILLYEIHGDEKRTIIPFEEIPQYVKDATIAIEDQGFYQHPAVDWRAVIRAVFANLLGGWGAQGGSTITQQLVKNAFLTPEKTLARKIKEWVLAYRIEDHYSKDEILGLYLNQIPYGSNAYGIEAAAQIYFAKSVPELTLGEISALAAIAKAPSYYSPWGSHKEELLSRANYVLEQMRVLSFIDEEELRRAQNEELAFQPQRIGGIKAPHFVMMVRKYLNEKYGEDVVERGGLRVITTLDWNLQQQAEDVVVTGAERNTELYSGTNAALVAQDATNGHVLALVGSRNYFDSEADGNFNVAAQGLRQPGSSFKPFAYITAFQKGYTPDTIIFDLPTEFSSYSNICPISLKQPLENLSPEQLEQQEDLCFRPQNYNNRFSGPLKLREALSQSVNVASVKTLYLAGVADTIKNARSFGITTLTDPNRYGLSLVLGGGEVTLYEMVGAYSVFAQEGVRHPQSLVLSVEDAQGNILERYIDTASRVIDAQYARLLNNVLSDVEARRPLFGSALPLTVFPDREVALKTGTTNDYRDAWTIGYTPSLVVGVWAGNNDNTPMNRAGSISAAIPLWSDFMKRVIADQPLTYFARPEAFTPQKSTLRGEYIVDNQVHTILHYVDKKNPLGAVPLDPTLDSQYYNWEVPVQEWVAENITLLTSLFNATTTPTSTPPF